MRMATFVGGPRDGESFDPRGVLGELHFEPERPARGFVRAESAIDLMLPTGRAHVYERERIDGYPTLSWAYRGLR